MAETVGSPGGGHSESKVLQRPLFEGVVASPRRPISAMQYLRQPSDASIDESWQAAAQNLGSYSNRMPIDPLRASREHDAPLTARRRVLSARNETGSVRGELELNLARTPSLAAQVVVGAQVVQGGRRKPANRYATPTFAQYYQVASIPRHSRKCIGEVGAGYSIRRTTIAPMSPIYIEKNRTAEWTSDSTLHPLVLSRRSKGWTATPAEAAPKHSPALREAGRESTKTMFKHLVSNEARPHIKSFFLDGLDSGAGSEASRSSSGSPSHSPQMTMSFKAPDPRSAGNGLVQAYDDRCKPGARVKVAFSFCMESWARDFEGQVGILVDRSPFVSGSWRVRFPGKQDLVECSVGLMGRYHLVYADEDTFEDAGENSKILVRSPSKRSVASSP